MGSKPKKKINLILSEKEMRKKKSSISSGKGGKNKKAESINLDDILDLFFYITQPVPFKEKKEIVKKMLREQKEGCPI